MGAFFLLRHGDTPGLEKRRETLLAVLARQGFESPRRFTASGCSIFLYDKLAATGHENAFSESADSFCLSVGTFFYCGTTGREALQRFHADFRPGAIPLHDVAGQFCLILAKHGVVHLLTDRVGLFKTYRTADTSLVTSSFLAAVAACDRLTVDAQSLYEYVLFGAAFGNRTVFDEIELVDPEALLSIGGDRVTATDLAPIPCDFSRATFAELLEVNADILRRYFAMLAGAFGNRISSGLSGGYDSRLMLALLRSCGVAPYVFVYGADSDCDVQVARQIAAGEGFALHHTDKQAGPQVDVERFPTIIENNLHFFDGCPYAGIFDNGTEAATRRERCHDGALTLNGMIGELFRRPDLPNRCFSTLELVWRYYCWFDPAVCTDRFEGAAYCDAIARKMARTLRLADDVLSRPDVAWTRPTFYARYWAGGTVSLNNRLSPSLLPFCDLVIAREAVRLPLAYRHYGIFEAALIRAVDPRLAAYPSCYGHDFASAPPLERIVGEWRATVRAPIHYRFMGRPQAERPYYLEPRHVDATLDGAFPYLRRFFHLDRVRDALQYNRICTLEYLFQKCSPCAT